MEDEEALETSALVGQLADAVQNQVNDLLSNGVVATGIVVGCILFASDELLRVEERTVGSSADLVNNSRLEINEDSTGNMLSRASLREEGVERVITTSN